MDWRDGTQAAKRRRLNNDHQQTPAPTQPHPQSYLALIGSNYLTLTPHGQHTDGTTSDARGSSGKEPGCLAGESGVASQDIMDGIEHRPSECCYGMLSDIPVKLKCELNPTSGNIPLDFHSPNKLSSKLGSHSTIFEIPCPISSRILSELQSVAEIKTQLSCHSKLESSPGSSTNRNSRRRGKPLLSWFLNIIIYGTEDLEEKVGEYLSKHKMYLQDPLGCERCIPYRNPHIIPPESGETVMTDSFDSALGDLEIERLEVGPDLLAQLVGDEIPLPEMEAPDIVQTALFRHQKQALSFMVRREEGWALEGGTRDVWSRQKDVLGRPSGYSSNEAPPDFRGGLLADDMGLGKTLSMICLITANQACSDLPIARGSFHISSPLKTTLLIVPPARKLITLQHLQPGKLKCHTYHGQNRKGTIFLGHYDVVITTYHTVSAIWRRQNGRLQNEKSIFSLMWHRVILDEAHTIQNPQSQLAQACFALRSMRRWAITGTPIQNKLTDFASLVRFLQVYPYSDQKTFEEEIVRPWQNHHNTNAQGFLRLKSLVRAITIRRTKAVIQLPPRIDEVHHLNFAPAERDKYEAAKIQSRALLEEAISSGNQSSKTFNALWLLNNLRLICNHGLLAQSSMEKKSAHMSQNSRGWCSGEENSNPFFDDLFGGAAACSFCGADLLEDFLEGSTSGNTDVQGQLAPYGRMICERCSSQMSFNRTGQMPLGISESLDSSESSGPATPGEDDDGAPSIESMSTKIKALTADLSKHHATEKSVVFSYWTHTLDLVQLMLDDCGIAYTRIDGKSSLCKRADALRAFQYDNFIRVILVSITCGGAGLDLTAGSRAYLLEPHWNPMIEEQALCRVHRVGQKRGVTTIRYLMRDSFEEQIVDIQKRKKMLAQVTFAQGRLSEAGIGLGTLQYLKTVLG
ncbi:SNF2 family N-terminal domain-containing protein [Bisporella sp. PMI_857]|nr:SNF2 family N-terminal domain-containing protein [Bisporella sp. PMI_857]